MRIVNRRSFLASLLATATLDPEKLLWVPGKKTIFMPPVARTPALLHTSPELLSISANSYYTVPSGLGIIREIHLLNISNTERAVTINFVAPSQSMFDFRTRACEVQVPAYGGVRLPFNTSLAQGVAVLAKASAPNAVMIRINAIEY